MGDLQDLLRTHQATAYTVCFQVLRSAHDAEDAAQDALLEVARQVHTLREPRALKKWICRVALHTALDHLKRRARRSRHEGRKAAMHHPAPDPARNAVHEALAQLDDDDRCLLVEKYFERATLEEIGAREGVSAAAVGKRVDRAKERLRRRLIQAGFASAALSVDSLLEAAPAVPSTPTFTLPEVAAGAGVGASTLLMAWVVAATATGGATWIVRSGNPGMETPAVVSDIPATAPGESRGRAQQASEEPHTGAGLRSRLARFRTWYDRVCPPQKEATFSLGGAEGPGPATFRTEIEGLRNLILAHPSVFLEWLRFPENVHGLAELLAALAIPGGSPDSPLYFIDTGTERFQDFPSALMEGVLALIPLAPDDLKEVLLGFAGCLKEAPAAWRSACTEWVARGPDAAFLPALRVLLNSGGPSLEETRFILDVLETGRDQVRCTKFFANVRHLPDPTLKESLLSALEAGRVPDSQGQTSIVFLERWLRPVHPPDDSLQDRAVELFARALRHDRPDIYRVVNHSLSLAPHRAEKIVLLACSRTTRSGIHQAIQELLGPLRAGGRTPQELKEVWSNAWSTKRIPAGGIAEQR